MTATTLRKSCSEQSHGQLCTMDKATCWVMMHFRFLRRRNLGLPLLVRLHNAVHLGLSQQLPKLRLLLPL